MGLGTTAYTNPNRFFVHWFTSESLKKLPISLQEFLDPVSSIYAASAIIKLVIQVMLAFIISKIGSLFLNNTKSNVLIGIALLLPLFQTFGYNRYMGIIDQSIVYTFSYALPMLWLLIFIYAVLRIFLFKNRFIFLYKCICILMIPLLVLGGPLQTGILLILVLLLTVSKIGTTGFNIQKIKQSKQLYFSILLCFLITMGSLYSLYVGSENTLNQGEKLSLVERYQRLPLGLFKIYSRKLGPALLLGFVILNSLLLKFRSNNQSEYLKQLKWIAIFCLFYLLLLPLGGFRQYREYLIRYDTFLPVTISLCYLFMISSIRLLSILKKSQSRLYLLSLMLFAFVFLNADQPTNEYYQCERQLFSELIQSDKTPAVINDQCCLMEWQIITDPENSILNAELFYFWNITSEVKYYYQSENENKN